MKRFKFIKTPIEGLYVIEPHIFKDSRGYFFESYNYNEFKDMGIDINFVQDNQSRSRKGVLRGLHFQKENSQGKLVRVLSGEVFDVAVDLREKSPTFGKWFGVILSSEKKNMFYIPKNFAHGFLVLSDEAEFFYKCTDFYSPSSEAGIIWDDKDIDISWPLEGVKEIILSEKDKNNMTLKEYKNSLKINYN